MRLVLSAAVLALWTAENPKIADAFSMLKPRHSHSGLSITTMPTSSLHMSTIERPMTAPGSPNSSYSGHPFGSYGKPENNSDENSYSYGPPKTPPPGTVDKSITANNSNIHNNQYSRDAPADSFEAYMQGRNNSSNPSSPSDNYSGVQSSSNNFGAPSTPTPSPNTNNFGAPPSTPTTTTTPNGNFGAPPSTPTQPINNYNSFESFVSGGANGSSSTNFGAPSTPPPAPQNSNSYSPPQTNNNFGAPSTPGNSPSPAPAAPQQSSFEAYMRSQSSGNNNNNNNNNSSPSFPGSATYLGNNSDLNSRIAAAADPNSPLPPYMSPSSLDNDTTRSANLPGSPDTNGRPEFRPPMPGTQPQRSTMPSSSTTNASATNFQQQGPQISPPLSAPLARVGVPNPGLDIGLPSEELVGRLDQVLTQQQEFSERLDRVDEKIDRSTQENIERTQAMLNNFKEENKKTQETFMNRINGDIRGMRTTMDRVLGEQRDLLQKQQDQSAKFADLEKSRSEQAEKLRSLEYGANTNARNNNNGPMNRDTPNYMNQSNNSQRRVDENERELQQRLNQAQARKEELLGQLEEMQRQEELYMKGGRGSNEDPRMSPRGDRVPPPPPYASRLDQEMNPQGSPRSRYDEDSRSDFEGMRQPRFEEEDEDEQMEEPPRRMMRDRLGKASGEELYSRNVGGGARRNNLNDDENDFRNDAGDRRMRMDPEEERRLQHERMMRRDPVTPPEAMGPAPRQPGSPAGRYDPRRGGPFGSQQDEIAYDISSEKSSVRQTLGNMRSFKGDEQVPNKSIFDGGGGGIGSMGSSMGRRGSQSQQQQSRKVPANQRQMGRQQQQQEQMGRQQQQRNGALERRTGLSEPPPPNPLVDKKIEHFLMEILKNGPKPHFDKEIESLLMVKYSPLFSWLKPANMSFLRNVLVTFLQHKGCQVEMNIKSASPKATREWEELLNILSFELEQRTGEKPRVMEEPDNQWGIYGSKNTRLKVSGNNPHQQREQQRRRGGGLTPEEAARRKMRNDKAFRVSEDPTDPTTRLL